jgi:hypothetical protein
MVLLESSHFEWIAITRFTKTTLTLAAKQSMVVMGSEALRLSICGSTVLSHTSATQSSMSVSDEYYFP